LTQDIINKGVFNQVLALIVFLAKHVSEQLLMPSTCCYMRNSVLNWLSK